MTKTVFCAVCGKEILVPSVANWQYKRRNYTPTNHKGRTIYFCGYNCEQKYDKEHPYKKRMTERKTNANS